MILELIAFEITLSLFGIWRDIRAEEKEKACQRKSLVQIPPRFNVFGCCGQPAIKKTDHGKNRQTEYNSNDSIELYHQQRRPWSCCFRTYSFCSFGIEKWAACIIIRKKDIKHVNIQAAPDMMIARL